MPKPSTFIDLVSIYYLVFSEILMIITTTIHDGRRNQKLEKFIKRQSALLIGPALIL